MKKVRSIPDITSTGPNRGRRVSSIKPIGATPKGGKEWGETNIQPVIPVIRNRARVSIPSFPTRAKPEVIEDENYVWVIVEFPGHTDISDEIEWSENGNILSVKSMLLGCPYQNKIALPANRGKQVEVKLHHGFFIVRFEK